MKKQAADISRDAGFSAVKVLWWSFFIYPSTVLAGLFIGGTVVFFLAQAYIDGILLFLAASLGVAAGGIGGFFAATMIISGLFGDVMFDAGWQGAKLGWTRLRRKKKT